MIPVPPEWLAGEVAIIGLGKSGSAAATLLAREGARVYASDASDSASAAAHVLSALGIAVQTGGHDLERIGRASLVVVSPGVPPDAPPLAAARAAGVPIVSEIEVGLRALPDLRYVAVTGTNGKTTTTALIAHLLRALGHEAIAAGNIGVPLADVAIREQRPAWVALEISSFQLHDTPSIAPPVGVLTNLTPDHLDRYASVDDYFADKARLFANADARSKWVLGWDSLPVRDMLRDVHGEQFQVSTAEQVAGGWYDRANDSLVALGSPLLPRRELGLLGDHNVANALTAALSVMVADEAHQTPKARECIAEGLRSFTALPHRLELVGEFGGVQWINDSKATNVSSTLVALLGMTEPTIVLLGGRHKGEPYTSLADPLRRIARKVIAYGEAAPIIEQDLGGLVPLEPMGSDFEAVIARACELAQPGDVVLLSPACSSYDMFANYEERGATFKRLATATVEGGGEGKKR